MSETSGGASGADVSGVDHRTLFRQLPTSYMVMDTELRYVDVNEAYLATTGRTREELVGQYVFDAFPPEPEALDEDGVSFVQKSFERARDTGRPDPMPLQQYAIPDGQGGMSERWWSLISVPVLDAEGRVVLVVQRAEDVTDWARERATGRAERERSEELGRRVQEVEADLYKRAHELEAALAARSAAAARAAALAAVAVDLTSAESVEDLAKVVFEQGLPVLGGAGGAIAVLEDDVVRLTMSDGLGARVRTAYGEIALDSDLPVAHVVRTGERVLLPDLASRGAWASLDDAVAKEAGRFAWAVVPLRLGDDTVGALAASWVDERSFSADELELLDGLAAQVAVALERIRATAAERAAAAAAARLSESLQRSLLTEPPQPDDLVIAVRYQPAAQEARVGGDWYDAFVTEAGSTLLTIGDVGGHDREAAAAMAQLRNLLRGTAFDSTDGPGVLLRRLDRASQGLGIASLATAFLGRLEGDGDHRVLRWSNAGHPPPVLRLPSGDVVVLDDAPDLLLGLDRDAERRDHVTPLPVGSLLVLYTDGLVERRDADIDTGLQALVTAVRELPTTDPERAADAVLRLGGETNEDDIALLVLRVD